jgi:hypothetical protein
MKEEDMMKRLWMYIVPMLAVSLMGACREDETELNMPDNLLNYQTPSGQFEAIWQSMLTSYVMWDIDSTDWGAVYEKYMPEFEALDEQEYVATDDLQMLYVEAFKNIRDHHLNLKVQNLWMGPDETSRGFYIVPGWGEVASRDYYHDNYLYHRDSMEVHPVVAHLLQLEEQGKAGQVKYGYFTDSEGSIVDVVSAVIEDRIPYFYFSSFNLSELIQGYVEMDEEASRALEAWESFRDNVIERTDDEIDGVIFDLRGNGGGMILDEQYLLGLLIDEPLTVSEARYKIGLGMYDYSPWTPFRFYPSARHREGFHKPIVALVNIWSVSMAEQNAMAIRNLPNGIVIGERTFGGHGSLNTDFATYYSGIFGNENGAHYCYMANHATRTVDGQILEGIGVTPDITLPFRETELTNGNDTWMDRAISYIQNGE